MLLSTHFSSNSSKKKRQNSKKKKKLLSNFWCSKIHTSEHS